MSRRDNAVVYELVGNALGSAFAAPELTAAGVEQIPEDVHRAIQLGYEPDAHQAKRSNNAIQRAMKALRAKHLAELAGQTKTHVEPREPRHRLQDVGGRRLLKPAGRK